MSETNARGNATYGSGDMEEVVEGTQSQKFAEKTILVPETQDAELKSAAALAALKDLGKDDYGPNLRRSCRSSTRSHYASAQCTSSDDSIVGRKPPSVSSIGQATAAGRAGRTSSSSASAFKAGQKELDAANKRHGRSVKKLAAANSELVVLQEENKMLRASIGKHKNNEVQLATARHNYKTLKEDVTLKQKEIKALKSEVATITKKWGTANRNKMEAQDELKIVKDKLKAHSKLQQDYNTLVEEADSNDAGVALKELRSKVESLRSDKILITKQLKDKTNEINALKKTYESWDENQRKREHEIKRDQLKIRQEEIKANGKSKESRARKQEMKEEHRLKKRLAQEKEEAMLRRKDRDIARKNKDKATRAAAERAKIENATTAGFFASNMGNQAAMAYASGIFGHPMAAPMGMMPPAAMGGGDIFQRMRKNQLNPGMHHYSMPRAPFGPPFNVVAPDRNNAPQLNKNIVEMDAETEDVASVENSDSTDGSETTNGGSDSAEQESQDLLS